jgi:hypothetical protein
MNTSRSNFSGSQRSEPSLPCLLQLISMKRFEQKRLTDFAGRPNDSLFLIETGHDRDRHLVVRLARLPQHIEPIEFRYVDIEQHGVVRA